MNKNSLTYIAMAMIMAIPVASFAQTASPSPASTPAPSPAAVTDAPASGSSGSSSSAPAAPSTGTSGSSIGPSTGTSGSSNAPATPSTGSSGSSIGSNPPSTGTSGSSIGQNPPPTGTSGSSIGSSPSVPPSNGGGSNPTGSTGSFSSGGSYLGYNGYNSNVGIFTPTGSCPLLPEVLMERGWNNNPVLVAKLQSFLKNTRELDVDVTGTFDMKTENAVKDFQNAYLETIMGPWGATQASGNVYITTVKKINELACKSPLTLTPDEMAIIDSYKAMLASNDGAGATVAVGTDNGIDASGTPSLDVTATPDQNGNTAAVGNLSIFQKFWNFIVSLFR